MKYFNNLLQQILLRDYDPVKIYDFYSLQYKERSGIATTLLVFSNSKKIGGGSFKKELRVGSCQREKASSRKKGGIASRRWHGPLWQEWPLQPANYTKINYIASPLNKRPSSLVTPEKYGKIVIIETILKMEQIYIYQKRLFL